MIKRNQETVVVFQQLDLYVLQQFTRLFETCKNKYTQHQKKVIITACPLHKVFFSSEHGPCCFFLNERKKILTSLLPHTAPPTSWESFPSSPLLSTEVQLCPHLFVFNICVALSPSSSSALSTSLCPPFFSLPPSFVLSLLSPPPYHSLYHLNPLVFILLCPSFSFRSCLTFSSCDVLHGAYLGTLALWCGEPDVIDCTGSRAGVGPHVSSHSRVYPLALSQLPAQRVNETNSCISIHRRACTWTHKHTHNFSGEYCTTQYHSAVSVFMCTAWYSLYMFFRSQRHSNRDISSGFSVCTSHQYLISLECSLWHIELNLNLTQLSVTGLYSVHWNLTPSLVFITRKESVSSRETDNNLNKTITETQCGKESTFF